MALSLNRQETLEYNKRSTIYIIKFEMKMFSLNSKIKINTYHLKILKKAVFTYKTKASK